MHGMSVLFFSYFIYTGFKRVEALAALFSVSSLALLSILLAVEGIRRIWLFAAPMAFPSVYEGDQLPDVDGKLMSGIATIGVLVNVALAFVLGEEGLQFHGHSHDHDHGEEEGGCSGHGHGGHGHDNISHKESAAKPKAASSSSCHGGHDHGHDHGEHSATEKTFLLKDDEEGGTSHELVHSGELAPSDDGKDASAGHNNHLASDFVPKQRNINLHAAYLHVLGDLLQSISVLIAGIVIWIFPTWKIIDPICTLLFCVIVLRSTFGTFKSSLSVLMEEVPPNLSWSKIYDSIAQVEGVSNVHDLHIWSVSHGRPALSVHVNATDTQRALVDISNVCHAQKIDHATIQIQPSSEASDDKCISCSIGEGMDWSKNNPCVTPDNG
jgi:zinc transporter 2